MFVCVCVCVCVCVFVCVCVCVCRMLSKITGFKADIHNNVNMQTYNTGRIEGEHI